MVVGVPYHHVLPAPFVQSVVGLLEHSHRVALDVRVAWARSPAIHLSRENLLRHFLRGDADFLVMVDTDQVFTPECVERLVRWDVPLVAPVIVNRLGDPKPVAFRREGVDLQGLVQYSALTDEVWAYLSRYDPARLACPAAVLPQPDRGPSMAGVPEEVLTGLDTPLLAVDAVGGGMTCLSRECAERIDSGPHDRYFDWETGGEDLSFCRRVLAAGYAGFDPDWASSTRPHGIFVDRGCLVGHLTEYARGAVDLGNWLKQRSAAPAPWAAAQGLVAEGALEALAEGLAADGARADRGPWETERLPEEMVAG